MRITIKQHDVTDCGAACLASVSAYYKLRLPISRIRQYAATDTRGTNVLGLIAAAERLGFEAKGVRGLFESIFKIPLPAIAHVVVNKTLHHYVVIFGIRKKYIKIMDPADGKIYRKTHEEFKKEWTGVLILLLPGENFETDDKKISLLKRFFFLIKPHRAVLLQALFGAAVYTVLGLSMSVYVQKIIDYVLIAGNVNLLNILSVAMIALLLVQLLINMLKSLFILKTGQYLDARLILGYYKHLLKLPQRFFDTMRVGEIISRVNDAVKIRTFINEISINFIVNIFIVIFSFAVMFTYYWKLACIVFAIIPVYLLIYWAANAFNKKNLRTLMERAANLESQLVESIHATSTIKRFGIEEFAAAKTETKFIHLLDTIYTAGKNAIRIGNTSELVSRLFTIIVLWVGSYWVIKHSLTPGELLSFYTLIGYFTGPAAALISMNKNIQDAVIAADRLFEIMDLEQEETASKVELQSSMIGDIVFRDVSFRYGNRDLIFENLDLLLPAGKITAVVGESGSGKSTLMSLLQNIYHLKKGNISIGDYDIMHISNKSLRGIVSVVPQQVDLFAGNFIDNIAIGEYEPDIKKILDVCTVLGITEFTERMPAGLHTYLGENGVSLSGGQRQRIAIARALYRQPEILILDEATSSLDSSSEKYVQDVMQSLREQGKTILIIAHRLSTIRNADKIIVLDKGKMAEEGTHHELIRIEGIYKRFWTQQTN